MPEDMAVLSKKIESKLRPKIGEGRGRAGAEAVREGPQGYLPRVMLHKLKLGLRAPGVIESPSKKQ